jgi:hypothetical protein
MKKYLFLPLAIIAVTLISWGVVGHKTVATIAYNHLTPNAKAAVKALLGDTSMADVASWADEVIRQPEYRNTASWHYLNVPVGLSYKAFTDSVTQSKKSNVYTAVQASMHVLTHENNSIKQRREALKFLIHFVGDLHQPMHVSRAEDKGGNTIQVQFDGQGTNLHSLWDSKLVGKEGKTFEQMSIDYDKATPQQIKQWQSDDVMKWLFESYQISSKLYPEIEQSNKLDDTYYKSHIGIVNERIEMAGIRLAGLLNRISIDYKANNLTEPATDISQALSTKATQGIVSVISIGDASKAIGQTVNITSKAYSYKELNNMTLVNLGAEYPHQLLTLVLKGSAKKLAKEIEGKTISVTGKIEMYKDKPEIVVIDPKQVQIIPIVGKGGTRGG